MAAEPRRDLFPGVTLPAAAYADKIAAATSPLAIVTPKALTFNGETIGDPEALLREPSARRLELLFQMLRKTRTAALRGATQKDPAHPERSPLPAFRFRLSTKNDFAPLAPEPGADEANAPSVPFDRGAAQNATGAVDIQSCRRAEGHLGAGSVKITFSPSGNVEHVVLLQGPFEGTAEGTCILDKYRSVHVPPFSGGRVDVKKSFMLQ